MTGYSTGMTIWLLKQVLVTIVTCTYCCLVFSSLYAAFSDQLSCVLGHKVLIVDR